MARTKRSSIAEQVQEHAYTTHQKESTKAYTADDLITTGSTLLNLALSDNVKGGWLKGTMANIIGDSSAGKSFAALTTFAETHAKGQCDDYALIYDDVENANAFDMAYLFGQEVADRIIPPNLDEDDEDAPSDMIEDFHANIVRALAQGPCIYCLDSFDALNAEADEKKSMELLKAREAGKDAAGSYGMAKAKKSSEILRQVCGRIKKTSSFLCIVSQTRDNIDPMSPQKKTRSGGKALKFYATHELWLANGGALKRKDRIIGVRCKVKISKNKLTGKVREVEFPIYYDYGIDNIGSCVDFLVKEKHWPGGGSKRIEPKGLDIEPGLRAKIIKQIEAEGLEDELDEIVSQVWFEIEESLRLNRKPKYK